MLNYQRVTKQKQKDHPPFENAICVGMFLRCPGFLGSYVVTRPCMNTHISMITSPGDRVSQTWMLCMAVQGWPASCWDIDIPFILTQTHLADSNYAPTPQFYSQGLSAPLTLIISLLTDDKNIK